MASGTRVAVRARRVGRAHKRCRGDVNDWRLAPICCLTLTCSAEGSGHEEQRRFGPGKTWAQRLGCSNRSYRTPPMGTCMLIVFSGLPGVGKTTIAQALARELRATYVRVDTIEDAILADGGGSLVDVGAG
jgi:DNA polymerase III delta prime subunit